MRNLGYGNRSCLDAQGGKKGLRKPVSLYPCHRQGGNQVNMKMRKTRNCLVAKIIGCYIHYFLKFSYYFPPILVNFIILLFSLSLLDLNDQYVMFSVRAEWGSEVSR